MSDLNLMVDLAPDDIPSIVRTKVNLKYFQVLSPRSDIGIYSSGKRKKRLKELERGHSDGSTTDIKIEEQRDPALIVCFIFYNLSLIVWSQYLQILRREILKYKNVSNKYSFSCLLILHIIRFCIIYVILFVCF